MPVFAPIVRPRDPKDLSVLRWSVRTDGRAGFVFVNNYVRGTAMPARPEVQFHVALPQGNSATVPAQPVDIPSGAFFAWPFGLQLGAGVELRYAPAQLMSRLTVIGADAPTHVLFCIKNIRCELSLQGRNVMVQAPRGIKVTRYPSGVMLTRGPDADALSVITVHVDGESHAKAKHLILLSPEAAEDTWKLPFVGVDSLVRTAADIWVEDHALALTQLGDPHFRFAMYPTPPAALSANAPVANNAHGEYSAVLPQVHLAASLVPQRAAATVPPVHLGPALSWRRVGVAQAPDDQVWAADAAEWQLRLDPQQIPSGVSDVFLRVNYDGDEARLLNAKGTLLEDNFWNGQPWLVGLRRFAETGDKLASMQLQALPVRADAPVYFSSEARAALPEHGQKLEVKSVEAIAEYKLLVKTTTGPNGEKKTMP